MNTKYVTVCLDKYGRLYNLCFEHPSWEQEKKGQGHINIVVDAWTMPEEEWFKRVNK